MSEVQMSNPAIAQSGNSSIPSVTSQEMTPAIASTQPCTETTDIVELADQQLEAVAGGAGQRRRPEVA